MGEHNEQINERSEEQSEFVVKDFGALMDEENEREEHQERLNLHLQFIAEMKTE